MVTLKYRLNRKNASGSYDTIHYETSSNIVMRPSGRSVEQDLAAYLPRTQDTDDVPQSLTSGLTVLSPGKVYYGHNTDIYVIDSSLVAKYKWNKCEISTVYSWNRFNLTTTYKWNRYAVGSEIIYEYKLDEDYSQDDSRGIISADASFQFAKSYNFSKSSSRISFNDITKAHASSYQTDEEIVSYVNSLGFIGSYITNIDRVSHAGGDYLLRGVSVDSIEYSEYAESAMYKIENFYIIDGGPYDGDANIIYRKNHIVRDEKTQAAQGDYIDQVTSSSSSAYPSNGQSGSYWYVSAGSTTSKGSANGSVTSTNASAYPADGASGSYWYTSSGSTQQAGTVLGSVESYDSSAYPDNGILDGYWYVKQ